MLLSQSFAPWHDYYALLGQASATMTGLLFVAASVGSGIFSESRRGAQRMFLTASVVHFGCILVNCLIVLAPIQRWEAFGGLSLAGGLFGLAYSALAWRDTVHDGLSARMELEDRLWYAVAPAVGYLFQAGAGVALILRREFGCTMLAGAMGALLLIAIHNAWDITLWSITRQRDRSRPPD